MTNVCDIVFTFVVRIFGAWICGFGICSALVAILVGGGAAAEADAVAVVDSSTGFTIFSLVFNALPCLSLQATTEGGFNVLLGLVVVAAVVAVVLGEICVDVACAAVCNVSSAVFKLLVCCCILLLCQQVQVVIIVHVCTERVCVGCVCVCAYFYNIFVDC